MLEMRHARPEECVKDGKPYPKTARAFSVVNGDQVVAVTGYYMENGRVILFGFIQHAAASAVAWLPRACLKFGKIVVNQALSNGMPVMAAADSEIPGSGALLRHLGGENVCKEVYSWHGSQPGHQRYSQQ